jgi:IS66 Orf2 like protein
MITPSHKVRIFVASDPVDFRKGHDGLAALVQSQLRQKPFDGAVYVFRDEPLCAIGSRTMANACGSAEADLLGRERVGNGVQTARR